MKRIADVLLPWAEEHEPKFAALANRSRGAARLRFLAAVFTLRAERDRGIWFFELFEECEPSELIDLMLFERKDGKRVFEWMRELFGYPPDGMTAGAWIGALQAYKGTQAFPAVAMEAPPEIKPLKPVAPAPEVNPAPARAANAAGLFGGRS